MSTAPGGSRWAVVLSSHTVRELRKLERDQNSLGAIHRKIKELSCGHFTPENRRTIIGTAQNIPLFRARAPYDLRIIYQIDVLPDSDGNSNQVIKILRVDSRARIRYSFWVKVSARLKQVDPHYKDRCVKLEHMKSEDDNTRVHSDKDQGPARDARSQPNMPTEADMDEIQEIIMERFAPLNKSLYNSIVADLNMTFPMVLDEHERKVVNHSGASVVIGRSGTGKTTALIYKMRAIDQVNAVQGTEEGVRQLFVTRSRVLAQHVEATYQCLVEFTNVAFKSTDELKEIAREMREDPDRALVEFDTEVDLRDDLPKRFSELTNSNFPLFISFETLCSLLEADIRCIDPNPLGSPESRSLIGFGEFLQNYWPSFQGLARDLEPNLAYSEIVGVIKGSQAAFESDEGYLSRREYVDTLSYRQFPLPTHVRENIYSIFEIYSRNKRSRCETDPADRTRLILRNITGVIEQYKIDHLYVDEVQDNLMIDIYLLRSLVQNINNTYWSGDSAQTVVAGSAFRVNDLKAFIYRDQTDSSYPRFRRKAAAQFETFELDVNFRSLSGIVDFAGAVVQAIYDLFPESIDRMELEKAKHYGDPPTLFTGIQNEAGYFEDFLLGSRSASNRVVFGAQQAILVRDAETADRLDARLQGLCNVLTIMDSKGLEFDDVLIYDFFSSTPVPSSAWGHLSGNVRDNQIPPPTLCTELKLLYVAATRARRRCWIWDSGKVIDRLKTSWISRGLVRVEPASQMVGRLAASSSKAEWIGKGREYFSHRLYKLAAACFRQAGQENDAKVSMAYNLMTRAKLKRLRGDTPMAREDLISAASKMEECTKLPGIGNKTNLYYHAATCFEAAHELCRAAAAYIPGGRPTQGIQILFNAQDFKYGAQLLAENRPLFKAEDYVSFREQACLHFFPRREYNRAAKLFDTVDEQIEFTRKHNFLLQLKHILDTHHRYDELAEEYTKEKNINQAVECFVKAYRHHHTSSSIIRAVNMTISLIESILLVGGTYQKLAQDAASSLVQMVQPYADRCDWDSCVAIDLFYGYLCLNEVSLDVAEYWNQGEHNSQPRRMLAHYLAIKNNGWLLDDSIDVVLGYLDIWKAFKADILAIAKHPHPSNLKLAHKILGLSVAKSPESEMPSIAVSKKSIIYRRAKQLVNDNKTEIPAFHADHILHQELPKWLRGMLGSLHSNALESPWMLPRLSLSSPASLTHRKSSSSIGPDRDFSLKLLVLCKTLNILDMSDEIFGKDYTIADRQWLRRLFEMARPATGEVESFTALRSLPNSEWATTSLLNWVHRDWSQLCEIGVADISVNDLLLHHMIRSALQNELSGGYSFWGLQPSAIRTSGLNENLELPLQEYFLGQGDHRFSQATIFLEEILAPNSIHRIDATVLVHFMELLTREMILHMNPTNCPRFDKLLMPFSWIRALVYQYSHPSRSASVQPLDLKNLLAQIKQLSLKLRLGPPGRWLVNGEEASPFVIELLNLRLCWCVAFVIGHLENLDENMGLALLSLRNMSNDTKPRHQHMTPIGSYHKFSTVTNQDSCLQALCHTFRHESLTLILESVHECHPAKRMPLVRVITCGDVLELAKKMEESFVSSNRH